MDPWDIHWTEDDPWRYYYNESRLNESVSIARTWKATLQTTTTLEAKTTTVEGINQVKDKGKRKIVENLVGEKS